MIFDDSLERYIGNSDSFEENFFDLPCSWCVKLCNIDVSMFLHWWFVNDSLKEHWWHYKDLDANAKDHWSSCCENHQNVDVPLLLDWLLVDDTLKRRWWDLDDFDANNDDKYFFVLNSETLMFHYCFLDDSLMMLWKEIVEILIISTEFFLIGFVFFGVNIWIIDFSLLVNWRAVVDSSKKHRRYSEDFDANINDHKGFFWLNLRIIDVSLLLRRWFVDDALKNHWWHYEDLDANDKHQWSL